MRLPFAFPLVIAMLAACASLNVQADPVYRCGNTYSQIPCPGGRMVEATDVRSAAQRAEARRVAADEHRLAAQMKHDRLTEEAALRPAGAASLSETPTPAAPTAATSVPHRAVKKKRSSAKQKTGAPFVAIDDSTRKASRRP